MSAMVAVVLALVVGGLATPRHHTVSRSMTLPVASEVVWAAIRDVARYGEWRQELEDADLVDTDQPQVRWRETTTRGSITFGVVHEEAPHRMVARILDDDLPFTGEWTWQLAPAGNSTRVSITERGSVGNPVFRFISAHFLGHTKSIDRYLRSLAQRFDTHDVTIDDGTPV
ncbi:MAG: SRPBCC family protein [Gemmatimonadaceae bacterium]|nr:SRPBCC family protein [Gemmatimonadaceae bacterium]